MTTPMSFKPGVLTLAIATALTLSACDTSIKVAEPDDDHGHDHDHDHGHAESSGRLVFTEAGSSRAYVYDLAENTLLDTFELADESRLYASPGYRYALAVQRNAGQVQFIDSGLEAEEHGEHAHHHEHDPVLLGFTLNGEMPTHYDYFLTRGAVFFDGVAGVAAKVEVLSDHSISDERVLGSLELSTRQHGAAEVREDFLFVSHRSDPGSESTLPDFVEVYEREEGVYQFVEQFSEPCPGLHGSAINHDYVAFGCTDGILVIGEDSHDHSHDHTHVEFEAFKIDNPAGLDGRFGTLWGHKDSDSFVARAGQELYWVNPHDDGQLALIEWRSADNPDAGILNVAFNYSGNRFAILDDHGDLTIIRFRDEGHADYPFAIQSQFNVLETHGDEPLQAAIAVSAVNHQAYITDVEHQRILIVDLHDNEIIDQRDLDFVPADAVWLGFIEADDGHDH